MVEEAIMQFFASEPRIILGTQSVGRRNIMEELSAQYNGFPFETCAANIDEQAIRAEKPDELVRLLAAAKAEAILARHEYPSGYLITCDQVVSHAGRILEKPSSPDEARAFIRGYAASPASTVGSVMVTNLSTRRSCCEVDVSTILMTAIPANDVEALIAEGGVFHCAGGLMVEHPLVVPHVVRIDGSQEGIMGLSKALVIKLLLQAAVL